MWPAWKHQRLFTQGGTTKEEDIESEKEEWVDIRIIDPEASDPEKAEINVRERRKPRGILVASGSTSLRQLSAVQALHSASLSSSSSGARHPSAKQIRWDGAHADAVKPLEQVHL